MRASIALTLLLVAGCGSAAGKPIAGPVGPVVAEVGASDRIHWIPMTDGRGERHLLYTRVCFPAGAGPFRIAVINHGSPPGGAGERAAMKPQRCDGEPARWFLARGFAVVFPMRRGYGETGGGWAEGYGRCEDPDYRRAGLETARDVTAAVEYATALPRARPDAAVVVGVSAGGWGTIAFDSVPHPKVTALINMAGGRGGHHLGVAGDNCRPEALFEAAARYAPTAPTPMLWIYAANDSFFNPEMASRMHAAFLGSGGVAELIQLGAFGRDGHSLFGGPGGSRIWGPQVERYLAGRDRDGR